MKKLISLISILCSIQLSASIWQRVDGPYDYSYIKSIFEFNGNLYASNAHSFPNYIKQDNEWNITNIDLPTALSITFFKQVDSLAIFCSGIDVFISTDNGTNWKIMNPNLGNEKIGQIRQAEIIGQKIYAILDFGAPKKLYSYDINKDQWDTVNTSDGLNLVLCDYISKNGNYILAGSYGVELFSKIDYGFFISSDNGLSWQKCKSLDVRIKSVIEHNGIFFVGGLDKHLYISKDLGKTWEVDTNFIFPVDLFFSDGDNLYAGVNNVGVHLSTDNGKTWVKRHNGIWQTNIKKFLKFKDALYCQDDRQHIFQTKDNGMNWTICPLMTDSLTSFDLLKYEDKLLVATSGKQGLYESTVNGNNWDIFGNGFPYIVYKIYNWKNLFACILPGQRYINVSKDGGQNWNKYDVGIFSGDNFIQDIELIGGDTLLLATTHGTRFSTDFGESWHKFYTDTIDSNFETLNIVRIDENKLVMTAYNEGLFKSNDNGQSWEKVNTNFTELTSIRNATLDYVHGKLFAYIHDIGLYYSEDEGITWQIFNSNIEKDVYQKEVIYYEGNYIINSPDGIYITNDNGKNLSYYEIEEFKNGNTNNIYDTYIYDIAVYNGYLFVGSDIGIWRAKLSDLGIVKSSVESETERNYLYTYPPYPLPAKSEVKVQFYWDINIPMTVDDISIYDMTGRKIEAKDKLRLEKLESYNGNIIWDCSTTPAGIYLINIKHGTESKSVKVVVE